MATKRMLIDASHPEETRVVVVDGSRVEDFDVEVASRRQLKGNIYLAKVTRVEPSLQAAFVDYGGNRHGFLAFSEIHPDYYQIPIADRERLLAEQAAAERDAEADREGEEADAEVIVADEDDDLERRRFRPPSRYYKIQEVIKRRQIMLVQVAKEERGNKGAALTTYLSLAGRYCVLMPNTSRGGGISRKIAGATDRKRLKKIISELEVPEGMAVIVRTAGSGRSKAEIKRDYEYLVRLWSSIREITLQSTAPTLVYEEASLIKRSIRDLYGRDISEIIVQGEEEYRIAKEFMKLFISSHAKRVKLYEDADKPLFQQFGIEEHLDTMHQPTVQLRSGGYIVINPAEALVAIDVNSGRSTRERNIEETALRTNLEAADEIARQLRLRDLAGLIVIDFIDMENARNQGMVERRLKEAMKNDRARVQIGRISPFGLLELSRQRLRPSLIETCFEVCPACGGNGLLRTTESTALAILRKLEEEGIKRPTGELTVTVPPQVAMYLLNQKRRSLVGIEDRYGLSVGIVSDAALVPPDHRIDRPRRLVTRVEEEGLEAEEVETEPVGDTAAAAAEREEAARRGRRRRPRRRRRGEEEGAPLEEVPAVAEAEGEMEVEEEEAIDAEEAGSASEEGSEQPARKRRRRGKRGGRRRTRVAPEQPLEGEASVTTMLDLDEARETDDFAHPDEIRAELVESDRDEPANGEHIEMAESGEMTEAGASSEDLQRRGRFRGELLDATGAVEPHVADADYAGETADIFGEDAKDHEIHERPRGSKNEEESTADVAVPDWSASTSEIAVVGGARAALEDPAPDQAASDKEQSTQAEASLLETQGAPRRDQPNAVPFELGMPPGDQEPSAENDGAKVDEAGDAGPPLPIERTSDDADSVSNGRADISHTPSVNADRASEKERRTEVIRVGEHDERDGEGGPRRGWWQRLIS